MTTNAEPAALLPQATRALQWLIAQAPTLLSVLLIIAGGWLAILIARRAAHHLIHLVRIDVLAEHLGIPQRLYELGFHGGIAALTARLVTIIGQLIILHMALEQLGLHGLSRLAILALDHLPSIGAAAAIMAAGLFSADLFRRLITRPGDQEALLPTGVYYLTLAISGAMALEQLGFNVSLIHTIMQLIAAAAALSLASAAIVSGRQTSRNLVARRYATTMLRVGDHITTPSSSGAVTAFHDMHLAIADPADPAMERLIPYHELLSHTLAIRSAAT